MLWCHYDVKNKIDHVLNFMDSTNLVRNLKNQFQFIRKQLNIHIHKDSEMFTKSVLHVERFSLNLNSSFLLMNITY